jgi:hypothetical protein
VYRFSKLEQRNRFFKDKQTHILQTIYGDEIKKYFEECSSEHFTRIDFCNLEHLMKQ